MAFAAHVAPLTLWRLSHQCQMRHDWRTLHAHQAR
ncbi:Uncharacterised protein [Vibrio cholerae]|nr:Uncharacterised protein [Vibrio cholerae]CSI96605.1 Uncharacterised protein [Vibrio cholerae]